MRSFLLLVLTLMMTGCEAVSEAIRDGFTCKNHERNGQCAIAVKPIGLRRLKVLRPKTSTEFYKCSLTPFNQIAYPSAKTTITCDVPDTCSVKYSDKFLYKQGNIPEDISSTGSNGRFRFTNTNSGFNVTISNVSSKDAGVYWCGLRSKDRAHHTVLRQINLAVQKITYFTRSKTVGETFTYWCDYTNRTVPVKKFICKGEDPSVCQRVVSTTQRNNGRFSLHEDRIKMRLTVTVTDLTADDAGTYWCGAERSDRQRSHPFFHRLIVTVEGSSSIGVIIAVTSCGAVLVLIIVLIFYKRFQASKEKKTNTRDEGAQSNNEDLGYAEIQESAQRPDPETAPTTVYVTANFPTNISASMQNSKAQNISAEVSDNTYYNVWGRDHCPMYSTLSHPEDSLYSTVTNPQQR